MGDILDPASRLERLIALQEPGFAAGFQVLVAQIKGSLDLKTIADLLARGNLEAAFTEALRRAPALGNLYLNSFVAAAQDTAGFLNQNLANIIVDFDITNQAAVTIMREEKLRLIREFSQGQRAATREALTEGIRTGANPIQQARNFRDSIGLTEKQVKAVNNYKRLLEEGDKAVFDRALRDKRFDSSVRRAFEEGKPLTKNQVDKMVRRYRERYIKFRSETIARTESLRSVHQGNHNMYQQAIDGGELDQNNLENEWNTARDPSVRDTHEKMHGQTRRFNEFFNSPSGAQTLMPGGFGVAEEDINCRCAVGTRITQITAPAGIQVEILS